jgi:DNA-binding NtrC family response regulator
MKKQTAVEWLVEQIMARKLYTKEMLKEFEEALEMEKEQIVDAVIYGNRQEFYDGTEMIAEQYYKETYEN